MADRAGSSSDGERFDNEKDGGSSPSSSYVKVKPTEEMEMGDDIERQELLSSSEPPKQAEPEKGSVRAAIVWMVVNTFATIGIVSPTPATASTTSTSLKQS